MKNTTRILLVLFALIAMLISACTGVAVPVQDQAMGGVKPQDMPVAFTGVIESINGNQWVVNGQTITVDPAVVRDGPYQVGDTIKVEVNVQADGSIVVDSVQAPDPIVALPSAAPEASETPDASSTPDPVSSSTPDPVVTSDPNAGGTTFNNQGSEAFGAVDSINGNTIVIGGTTYQLANTAQIMNQIQTGAQVKIHYTLNADGTMTITEIQLWTAPQQLGGNSGSGNSGSSVGSDDPANHDQNDDHGGDDQHEDDHSGGDDSHNDDNSGSNSGNGS